MVVPNRLGTVHNRIQPRGMGIDLDTDTGRKMDLDMVVGTVADTVEIVAGNIGREIIGNPTVLLLRSATNRKVLQLRTESLAN